MKVLVSGGGGFIGWAAYRKFIGESGAVTLSVNQPADAADVVQRGCLVNRRRSGWIWSEHQSTRLSLERKSVVR
jgi:hypothetical protein